MASFPICRSARVMSLPSHWTEELVSAVACFIITETMSILWSPASTVWAYSLTPVSTTAWLVGVFISISQGAVVVELELVELDVELDVDVLVDVVVDDVELVVTPPVVVLEVDVLDDVELDVLELVLVDVELELVEVEVEEVVVVVA